MAHPDDQITLVLALFASAAGTGHGSLRRGEAPAPWGSFLDQLRQVTQADGTAICFEQDDGFHGYWSVGTCEALAPDVRRKLRNDRVYAQDSLPAGKETEGFVRAVKVRAGQAARVVVWVYRDAHRKDFRSMDGQQLSALVPYLGQASEIWMDLRRERMRAALSARLGAALGARWILFDRTGIVVELSSEAQSWAAGAGMHLARHKRLELSCPAAMGQFRAAFAACSSGADHAPGVRLAHTPIVELVLTSDIIGGEGLVAGFLREAPTASSLQIDQIARHFDLNRSEARLAALLYDGFTIRSAAAELGWTEQTARTCSKRIYARTETQGQARLVRKMSNSAVWFRK